jgi:hypothetical protein
MNGNLGVARCAGAPGNIWRAEKNIAPPPALVGTAHHTSSFGGPGRIQTCDSLLGRQYYAAKRRPVASEPDGHGVRESVYGKTERVVRRKLRELQRQVHTTGALPDAGNRTVNDLLDSWLETVTPNLKPRTITTYTELCERHIRPAIGRVRLARLAPAGIQNMLSRLQAEAKHRTAHGITGCIPCGRW